jgi:hypothetical protein
MKHFLHLLKGACACALATLAGSVGLQAADSPAQPAAITAIDILLQPDATMLQHAAANNERLRKVYPKGFTFDAAHTPHITLLPPAPTAT